MRTVGSAQSTFKKSLWFRSNGVVRFCESAFRGMREFQLKLRHHASEAASESGMQYCAVNKSPTMALVWINIWAANIIEKFSRFVFFPFRKNYFESLRREMRNRCVESWVVWERSSRLLKTKQEQPRTENQKLSNWINSQFDNSFLHDCVSLPPAWICSRRVKYYVGGALLVGNYFPWDWGLHLMRAHPTNFTAFCSIKLLHHCGLLAATSCGSIRIGLGTVKLSCTP